MLLQESGEMYLETILVLLNEQNKVRSVDVSEYMSFSKPSVSRAMGLLKEGKYIEIDSSGFITLTESGRDIAEKIYQRHTVISSLLESLGVSSQTAAEDACKIEHDISDESFDALLKHAKLHK